MRSGECTIARTRAAARVLRGTLAAACLLALPARAAKIGLFPLMGDGAAGRTTVISGVNFEPSTAYTVRIGGFDVAPAGVTSDAAGTIAATTLNLPDLPRGNLDVMLASATLTRSFTGAYRVEPNICLSPIIGDGRFGETWETNAAIPVGGWVGMVFRIEGWGFAAGVTIPENSITVGGAKTSHPAIAVSAAGRFPSATVVVSSNMPNGLKDLVISDGVATTFAGVYRVRRSIGMTPARGYGANGATIFIEGWGFTPGPTGPIRIGAAAVTPDTPTVATDGSFSATIRLLGNPGDGSQPVATGQETFPHCYDDTKANQRQAGIVPVTPTGLPNQAIRIQGMGGWTSGQSVPANSTLVRTPGADVATVHPAIPIVGGRFAPAWVVAALGIELNATGVGITDPVAGVTNCNALYSRRIIDLCPVAGDGSAGFTATVTGWGFNQASVIAADSITVGGSPAVNAARTINRMGYLAPVAVSVSALPNGSRDIVITDIVANMFAGAFDVRRTIGLSFIVGPGMDGEVTSIAGTGFAPGTIGRDTLTFGGIAVTHGDIGVAADGSFASAPLRLPLLGAGPYDVVAQSGEVFPQAYRVCNPLVAVSKHTSPGFAGMGSTVTYTISYTNASPVGDPRAAGIVLLDTIPARTQYVAGSSASTLPATVDWYHPSCSCWNAVDTPVTDVLSIRWTLASPLPTGASGYASFQVTVQ